MTLDEAVLSFESEGLRLEGRLHRGDEVLALVMLHPHPQYGGDMDNHVVAAACEVFGEQGATTLRFNFRGAGGSEGQYAGGTGEAEDARRALAAVRAIVPATAVVLAGYSFGAAIACRIAAESALKALVLISPPVAVAPLPVLPDGLPTLIISGAGDEVSPLALLIGARSDSCRVVSVPGVSHSWWPGAELLAEELAGFAASLAAI